jgi:hypothetical protein
MSVEANTASRPAHKGSALGREVNSLLIAVIIGITTYIFAHWAVPQIASQGLHELLKKFVGVSWPFFVTVMVYLYYVIGALLVETFALGIGRKWNGTSQVLHWAAEACPLVGLLTTFLSLLLALMVYGEAGPGDPKTQAAFIGQFAIAFGSSIAGGVLALLAFTLHRIIPDPSEGEV